MKKKNRISFLTGLIVLSLLSSCAENNSAPVITGDAVDSTAAETISEAETEEVYPLPEADFGGSDFNMLVRDLRMYYLAMEETTGDVFDDSVYTRNTAVSDRYHVKLNYISETSDKSAFSKKVKNSVMASDGAYDFVMPDYTYFDPTEGLFLNLLDIPDFNFSSPWWCSGWNNNLIFNGRMYSCVGDLCLDLLRNTHVVYFSKKAITDYGLESPYKLTTEGTWTFEKMQEMGHAAASDLNGDGKYTVEDAYGIYCNLQSRRGFLHSCGITFVSEKDGSFVLDFYNDRFVNIYTDIWELTQNDTSVYYAEDNFADFERSDAYKMFNDGRLMFIMAGLFAVDSMRASDTDFGIVPVPKYDDAQASYIAYNHGCSPVYLPKTAADPHKSALILEALNYESYKTVTPVYYDQVLKTKVSRDNESAEFLDLIFSSLQFDFAFVNDASIGVFSDISGLSSSNITSTMEKKLSSYTSKLEKMNQKYKEMDD